MRIINTKAALLFASAALLALPGAARAQPAATGTTTSGTPTGTTPPTMPDTTPQNPAGPNPMQSGGSMTPSAPANGNSTTNTTGQMNSTAPGTTSGNSSLYPACDRTQMHSGTSTTDTAGLNPNCPATTHPMPTPPESSTGATTPPTQ